MKKSFLMAFAVIAAVLLVACGDNNKPISRENSIAIGWCSKSIDGGIGASSGSHEFKACVQLVDTQLLGKAKEIIAIRVGLNAEASNCQVWLSETKDGTPFYTQNFTPKGIKWEYVKLDQPYKLEEGKAIWVGYTVTSDGDVIGYSTAKAKKREADQIAIDDKWYRLGDANIVAYNCIQAMVIGGDYSAYPQEKVEVWGLNYDDYVQQQASNKVTGFITNYGVKPAEGVTVSFKDGQNEKTVVISQKLMNGETAVFSFDDLANGSGESEFTVSAKNGSAESSDKGSQMFYGLATPRRILIEQFTGDKCGYCPSGAQAISTAVSSVGENKVVWMAHHIGYNEDNYTVDCSKSYTWFYGPAGTYAPACMIDRTKSTVFGIAGEYPIFNPISGVTAAVLQKALNVPAFVKVDVACALAADSTITVTVSGNFIETMDGARMNVFLYQDNIIGYQANGGNEYNHSHTIRHSLTSVWGDAMTVDADGNYTMTYTYKIPAAIAGTKGVDIPTVLNDMSVVAFVSKYNSSDRNGCRVQNANVARVVSAE